MRKMVSLTIRNRAAALVFILALLALGAVFLTVGFALLAGLAVIGGVVGTGIAAYRAIRGKGAPQGLGRIDLLHAHDPRRRAGLDPALEIAAPRAAVVRPTARVDTPEPPSENS